MFAHHILKPERTAAGGEPIWGTPKSSGSFSTLFESRIAFGRSNYQEAALRNSAPFPGATAVSSAERRSYETSFSPIRSETSPTTTTRTLHSSASSRIWPAAVRRRPTLPDQSVDAVVTDPPFFDNVHYSAAGRLLPRLAAAHPRARTRKRICRSTTRQPRGGATGRTGRLPVQRTIWGSCGARATGFEAGPRPADLHLPSFRGPRAGEPVLDAPCTTPGLPIFAVHPIKSEMSVARPKFRQEPDRSRHHYGLPQAATGEAEPKQTHS